MLHYIEEYGKYVEITGYRNISFDKAEAFLKENRKQTQQQFDIQFFDAELIATSEHLYFATINSLQAFLQKTNISKSAAVETMLYASAQNQIQKSIALLGIKQTTQNMAVVIIGLEQKQIKTVLHELSSCIGQEPDESVLEMSKPKEENIKKAFSITDEELIAIKKCANQTAIINLVIEHMALLAAQL